MLTKLDRYIIVKFLSTFFFSVALIISVAVVVDLSEKIDDFIVTKATTYNLIFDYYIYFIPSFYNLFNNLFIFIAVIFFTSKMAGNSEIISILAAGISYRRLLRPYFIAASLLGIISYLLNSWIVPYADKQKVEFENYHILGRRNEEHWKKNVHRQLEPGLYMFIDDFSKRDSIGIKFTLERFENRVLTYKLAAEKIYWNRERNTWTIEEFVERKLRDPVSLVRGKEKDIKIRFNPSEFFMRKEDVGVFNNNELNRVIMEERMRGAEKIEFYLVEKYRRTAMPFSTLILTLIGATISSRKAKGGLGRHIGLGFGLAFSFVFLNEMTFSFAHAGNMAPWIAVWIPNLLYLIIGLVLYRLAPK